MVAQRLLTQPASGDRSEAAAKVKCRLPPYSRK